MASDSHSQWLRIVDLTPEDALAATTRLLDDETSTKETNVLGIAEVAGQIATTIDPDVTARQRLGWAKVALAALRVATRWNLLPTAAAVERELSLRAHLIDRVGCDVDEDLTSPSVLVDLFRGALPITIEHARAQSGVLPTLGAEEMLVLRRIKNQLRSIALVRGLLPADLLAGVAPWIDLMTSLP